MNVSIILRFIAQCYKISHKLQQAMELLTYGTTSWRRINNSLTSVDGGKVPAARLMTWRTELVSPLRRFLPLRVRPSNTLGRVCVCLSVPFGLLTSEGFDRET